MTKHRFGLFCYMRLPLGLFILLTVFVGAHLWSVHDARALNISTYSDTLSDSAPGAYSNHTIQFDIETDIAPGGHIDLVPPDDFVILATSTFTHENVELYVNGSLRPASSSGDTATDTIAIIPGTPGSIRYTFNPNSGVSAGDRLRILIGDHTTLATNGETVFSTSTGSTTLSDDIGIQNATSTGTHSFLLSATDGSDAAYARFLVALIDPVRVGPIDTTEEIPPERFNGAPSGDVGGTTLSVELSVETNEFAICKYDTTASTSFASMENTFENTGFTSVVHSETITGLANDTTYTYYVRCIDDEGNFNIDDYEITFTILEVPEGDPNTEGGNEGDGSGTSDGGGSDSEDGSEGGSGGGSGGSSGGSSGGGGGGGGGGSGGIGDDDDDEAGGGFESSDEAYPSGDARVIINGYAFPGSKVIVLVDGQQSESGAADSAGKFSVTLDEIARGVYTFGIYAIDDNGTKSTTFSTSFSVQGGKTSSLSNINIMPSILIDPDPADVGNLVMISGFTLPDAYVTIEHQKDGVTASLKEYTATSDGDGEWSVVVDTSSFSQGTYKVRARAEQTDGVETDFSDYTYYGLGQEAEGQMSADLNRDGNVNLTDFSILLFHWGSSGGASDPPADINQDGDVSLTDFSIMLFQWTG